MSKNVSERYVSVGLETSVRPPTLYCWLTITVGNITTLIEQRIPKVTTSLHLSQPSILWMVANIHSLFVAGGRTVPRAQRDTVKSPTVRIWLERTAQGSFHMAVPSSSISFQH